MKKLAVMVEVEGFCVSLAALLGVSVDCDNFARFSFSRSCRHILQFGFICVRNRSNGQDRTIGGRGGRKGRKARVKNISIQIQCQRERAQQNPIENGIWWIWLKLDERPTD